MRDEPETSLPHTSETAAVTVLTEAMSYTYAAALRAAALLGIADHFDGHPRTVAELATAIGADASMLHRILRLLATRGIFREDAQGRFEATELSDAMRADAPCSARGGVLMSTMRTHWFGAHELVTSVTEGAPAFDRVFGMPFFDYLAHHADAGAEFHDNMGSFSDATRTLALAGYEFPSSGTVVDVGGGQGGFLKDILTRNPDLTGVLFDHAHVLADHCLDSLDAGRWRLASGDFFDAVPAGDLYVLTYILHDWSDEHCVRILRNCRDAMNPGGRVLVFDTVVPVGNEPSFSKELDILMAFMLTGRERNEADFRTLLGRAGLRVTRVIPTQGPLSVVEAVHEDDVDGGDDG